MNPKSCSKESKAKYLFKMRSLNNTELSSMNCKKTSENISTGFSKQENSLNNINTSNLMKIYSKPKVYSFMKKKSSYVNKSNFDNSENSSNNIEDSSIKNTSLNNSKIYSPKIIKPLKILMKKNPLKNINNTLKNVFSLSEKNDNKEKIKKIFIHMNTTNYKKIKRKSFELKKKYICLNKVNLFENCKTNRENKNELIIEQRQPICIDFNKNKENDTIKTIKIKIQNNNENKNTIKSINENSEKEERDKKFRTLKREKIKKIPKNYPKYNNMKNRKIKNIYLDVNDNNFLKKLNTVDTGQSKIKKMIDISNLKINNSFSNEKEKLENIEIEKIDIEYPDFIIKTPNKIKNINKLQINKNQIPQKVNSNKKIFKSKNYNERITLLKIDINNIILDNKNKQTLNISNHKIIPLNKNIVKIQLVNKVGINTNCHSPLKEKMSNNAKNIFSLKNNSREKKDKISNKCEIIKIPKNINKYSITNSELKRKNLSKKKSENIGKDKNEFLIKQIKNNKSTEKLNFNVIKQNFKTIEAETSKRPFKQKNKM